MALIEYRITVDPNGQATVLQDVQEIGPGDKIQFVASNTNTSIQFTDPISPFAKPVSQIPILVPQMPQNPQNPRGPLQITNAAGQIEQISQPVAVVNDNAGNPKLAFHFVVSVGEQRRTFQFQCGRVNNNGQFTPWGGPGLNSPDGGSTS